MEINGQFTKFRWICTVIGLLCSVADIGSDILVSVQYFTQGQEVWFALTVTFIIVGSLCTHVFSYAWFEDDAESEQMDTPALSKAHLVVVHLLQMGCFTRHFQLLIDSFKPVWAPNTVQNPRSRNLFGQAADLSMLRMFETYLESVPQLLLQLYIVLQHQQASHIQYISMVISFFNIAWSTVDYWRCLRRSLPDTMEIPTGLPTVVYLFYKVLTISARILSLTLLILYNIYNILALVLIWLVGTVWAHAVKTTFCSSTCLEYFYRATVGFILIFTFFNVKGGNTKILMTLYYIFSSLQNLSAPLLLFLFKPQILGAEFFLPTLVFILVANMIGLLFLVWYYTALHPQLNRVADEVDGSAHERRPEAPMGAQRRQNQFLSL
ncbi:XK-related protein 9 [Astyanax mexicanus]|uniref:XK-related protein n=1 Tax=Astyanax mexicanus TaxID=7994 RepID=A0A8B9HR90_ASTMX|nr:XK-related protein 9 [Astyanax mexicanus]